MSTTVDPGDSELAEVAGIPPLAEVDRVAAPTPDQLKRAHALAIDELAFVSHVLSAALGPDRPPLDAPESEGLRFYGGQPTAKFNLWRILRASVRSWQTWDALRGVKRITPPPPPPAHEEPDEAPGLEVPAAPGTGGPTERQPRLGIS
jgi:hypothetical protein